MKINSCLAAGIFLIAANAANAAALVHHWVLDEGSGSTAADSVGSADLSPSGTSWVTGYDGNGSALEFDGNNDDARSDSRDVVSQPSSGEIAIAGWFKTSSTSSSTQKLVDVETYFVVSMEDGTFIPYFDGSADLVNYGSGLNDGNWHHFVAQNDGSTTTMYVDGALIGTLSESLSNINNTSRFVCLGANHRGNNNFFDGSLDDIRIYDGTLTLQEIRTLAGIPNEAPVVSNDSYNVEANVQASIATPGVLGNDIDPDGDTVTASLVADVAVGTLNLSSNGSFTYDPPTDYTGNVTFTYQATDSQSNVSSTATVTLVVSDSGLTTEEITKIESDLGITLSSAEILDLAAIVKPQTTPTWRTDAEARIEANRKADLTIEVVDSVGTPVPGATVVIDQTNNAFKFSGSLIAKDMTDNDGNLSSNGYTTQQWQDRALALFNAFGTNNALKPRLDQLYDSASVMPAFMTWADANNRPVRGHTCIWPGTADLTDVDALDFDPSNPSDPNWNQSEYDTLMNHLSPYMRDAVADYISARQQAQDLTATRLAVKNAAIAEIANWVGSAPGGIYPGQNTYSPGWNIYEWDVINEPITNTLLMEILDDPATGGTDEGMEEMATWLNTADANKYNASCRMLINDYQIVSAKSSSLVPDSNGTSYPSRSTAFQDRLDRAIAAGGDLDAIGFQSRFKFEHPDPNTLYSRLDEYATKYSLPMVGTEFEIVDGARLDDGPNLNFNEYERAQMTEEIVTTYFSHPLVDGFTAWAYTRDETTAMIYYDGTVKLNGLVWYYLHRIRYNTTGANGTTDINGEATIRGFKGDYDVTVTYNSTDYNATATLLADGTVQVQLNDVTIPTGVADPDGLTVQAAGPTSLNVSWNDNSVNETGFVLEQFNGSTWDVVATLAADTTEYKVTGLSEDSTEEFRVKATGSGGDSNYSASASGTTTGKMNIIFFLADDLGLKDIVALRNPATDGATIYETPAMDSLVSEGLSINNAYASGPRCVVARRSIQTGMYDWRPEAIATGGGIGNEMVTIGEALQADGYRTCFIGKWHLGGAEDNQGNLEPGEELKIPYAQGYDVSIAAGEYGAPPISYFGGAQLDYGLPDLAPAASADEYLTDRLTDEAEGFITDAITNYSAQPFFMTLAHYAVHTPLEAKQADIDYFEARKTALATDLANHPKASTPYEDDYSSRVKNIQDQTTYAAMVKSLDDSLADLRAYLAATNDPRYPGKKLSETTIIVLTSDHGGNSTKFIGSSYDETQFPTSNYPLRQGKTWCYEGGLKIPVVVYWPGVTPAGATSDAFVHGADFYKTFLDMVNAPAVPAQHVDSISFVDTLSDPQVSARTESYHYFTNANTGTGNPALAVYREGDYKLVFHIINRIYELYNLADDPSELNDLSGQRPDLVAEMYDKLITQVQSTGLNPRVPGSNSWDSEITVVGAIQAIPNVPDADPSSLLVTPLSGTTVHLSWCDNSSNEEWFVIQRMDSGLGDTRYDEVAFVPANQTFYRDTGLQPGTEYKYRIQAETLGGWSTNPTSNETITTLTALDYTMLYVEDDLITCVVGETRTFRPLLNDEGDGLTITAFDQPALGTITQDGDQLVYEVPAGFTSGDVITYTVQDASGASATASITLSDPLPEATTPSTASVLEDWQFADAVGTELTDAANTGSGSIGGATAGAVTDGSGNLVVTQSEDYYRNADGLTIGSTSTGTYEMRFAIPSADVSGTPSVGANISFGLRESSSSTDIMLIRLHEQSNTLRLQTRIDNNNTNIVNFGAATVTDLVVRCIVDLDADTVQVFYSENGGSEVDGGSVALSATAQTWDQVRFVFSADPAKMDVSDSFTIDYFTIGEEGAFDPTDAGPVVDVNTLDEFRYDDVEGTELQSTFNCAGTTSFSGSTDEIKTNGRGWLVARADPIGGNSEGNIFRNADTITVGSRSTGVYELEFNVAEADLSGGDDGGANLGYGFRESASNQDIFLVRLQEQNGGLEIQTRIDNINTTIYAFGNGVTTVENLTIRCIIDLDNDTADVYYRLDGGLETLGGTVALSTIAQTWDTFRLIANTNETDFGADDFIAIDYVKVSKHLVDYSTWSETAFTQGETLVADTDDPDSDGVSNFGEFVLGGNPNVADNSILPRVVNVGGQPHLEFTLGQDTTDISYIIEYSEDLIDWVSITPTIISGQPGEVIQVPVTGQAMEKLFQRLRATAE